MSAHNHPCFHAEARGRFARIHLPVAPACNIGCGFCDRRYSCANESRPGVTSRVLSPQDALRVVEAAVASMDNLSVVGFAGPGDPLANAATLTTIRLVRQHFPHLLPCLSTNGLALPDNVDSIVEAGVAYVTVTVNAVDPRIGAHVYTHVDDGGTRLTAEAGAALLLERQEQGVRQLKRHGITVKINTVIIPGVNDSHATCIAQRVADWGADLMNCLALLPVAGTPLGNIATPLPAQMKRIRAKAECFLPQMHHCARCRADALGLLGESGTLMDRYPQMCPAPAENRTFR